MVMIGASILSADYGNMSEEVKKAENAKIDFFHVDIMDGHFVPNLSLGLSVPMDLKKITDFPLDVHLMVENPEKFIPKVAGYAEMVAFHAESTKYLFKTIDLIKEYGAKPIIALNPSTTIDCLEYVLDELYGVLVMSVEPGFSGQSFINPMVKKIDVLKKKITSENYDTKIFVDGGINVNTAPKVVAVGADALIAASAIYGKEDINSAVNELRNSVNRL
ncbi:Ribulose-phosphate 3-epimerase [Methanococcus vannielii SB]|jgi:ribulose-phosphate 3-epimerase|uniref:Ribulose-phosphate 3-epimerase n=1 Tax=Methanococcus vannielii (strain ATCC 35089 / DSM 1224 / JCM 13029 / OCM 148 / SB) TaxID=406327 RepID=A6UPC4_METVS|nr:ribulose-phosphate 3-epimerase [Methanococcus vannielii]ABR54346.1 Ribulose-phosphate 3-epimerase [Methanococcus vannielii SB]